MLLHFLEKAAQMGCDSIEIEYKDGKEWICAFDGSAGVSIASLSTAEAKPLFEAVDRLKKTKEAILHGVKYRLVITAQESFGEWVYRIAWKKWPAPKPGSRRP